MIYFFVADLYSRENVVKDLYSRKNILDKMLQYNESGIELSDNNVSHVHGIKELPQNLELAVMNCVVIIFLIQVYHDLFDPCTVSNSLYVF